VTGGNGETGNRGNGASRDFGLRMANFHGDGEKEQRRRRDDVAAGLVRLARADAVACAQVLDPNGNVAHG